MTGLRVGFLLAPGYTMRLLHGAPTVVEDEGDTCPSPVRRTLSLGAGGAALLAPDSQLFAQGTEPERQRPPTLELDGAAAHRYDLGPRLGVGGMGEVIAAHDERIGRAIALKRTLPGREHLQERFLREARIQARLEHPSIVPVYDIGVDRNGEPYFTMKRLAGRTLAESIDGGDVETGRWQLLQRFAEICLAVEYAHQRGVVHRDIKPSNIMLGDFGEVYLIDWGIAKLDTGSAEEVGDVVGTPGYLSPEQSRGLADVDGRTDVYALGAVLFELATGKPLLSRDDRLAQVRSPLVPLQLDVAARARALGVTLEAELVVICQAAVEADRERRLTSARALHDRLVAFLDGAADERRRRVLANAHASVAESLAEDDRGDPQRAIAEAARALALEPHHPGARAVLGQLLAAPPTTIPTEVKSEVEALRLSRAQRGIGWACVAYVITFLSLPIIWWFESSDWEPLLSLEAALGVAIVLSARFSRSAAPSARGYWAAIVGNAVYLALLSRLLGPIAITPAVAMMSVCLFVQHGLVSRWWAIIALHLVAVFGPFIAGELGWMTPVLQLEVAGGELIARSTLFQLSGPGVLHVLMATLAGLVIMAGLISTRHRDAQLQERAQTSLERWQVRALLP